MVSIVVFVIYTTIVGISLSLSESSELTLEQRRIITLI